MFSLIKQVLIVLLSFSKSLACNRTKLNELCLSLNGGCMVRHTLIDLNPVEIKYYPFMISLDNCSGSCNVLSPQFCFQKKQKTYMLKHLI